MRRTAGSLMVLLLLVPVVSFGSWVSVSSSQPQAGDVAVLEDGGSRTTLSLTFAGYEREEVDA
ncbi:hypothetical protein JXA88_12960, partial [Candidatus Fermentibacteria bacterium]|nr:hypothetical protein [Candidatus Fermentibacteria bacterium]